MKKIIVVLVAFYLTKSFSQEAVIKFETNGKQELNRLDNPFQNFIGEWTLQDDKWIQNWGSTTDTLTIPKHHTISSQVNTKNSLFSIIDGPKPNGHIFWSYNPVTKEVNHLSSFGELRVGVGAGSISERGDVRLKISFEGEHKNTYRVYSYKWITEDKYHMKSVQFGLDDSPTGLFYEGTFVRLAKQEKTTLRNQIEEVLAILDNKALTVDQQLKVYDDSIVHMAPGSKVNLGKEALRIHLKEQRKYGSAEMRHKIIEIETFENLVLMRGQVIGTYYPKNENPPITFRTKNLFVFSSKEGGLKIKKVIYNSSPNE
ncbi:hypothetical protein [Croceitalea rosinachiae]|uniref:DUF4440 domain-containing protein n=1 Tax=Croceitalea rosinachiae TaxID=3075596 RepID=A0ABU3AC88_9FLAO|nr:hypothetical protein [Croceitalea sp. F388]MDT0607503.1 hypothetical protein [Croceitalea sp. F388]